MAKRMNSGKKSFSQSKDSVIEMSDDGKGVVDLKKEKEHVMDLKIVEAIAIRKGWKVNPNLHDAQEIINGLNANKRKWGYYYCPCKIVTGDLKRDRNIRCPCKNSAHEIAKQGHCHCHLYYQSGKVKETIRSSESNIKKEN